MNKRIYFLMAISIASILLVVGLGCGSGKPSSTLEKIKKEKKLVVATHPVNPPFEFGNQTGVSGFDYDLGEAIGRELQVEVQWDKEQFEKCFEILQNGDVDIVLNAVTITLEREKDFLFSIPYYETGLAITTHQERQDIKNAQDLKDKKVGVQRNTTSEKFLQDLGPGAVKIVQFDSPEEAVAELNRNLLDAVVGDMPTLLTLLNDIKSLANLKIVSGELTHEKYGVVMRKADVDLKNEVDRIIQKMKASGEFNELMKKWKLGSAATLPAPGF